MVEKNAISNDLNFDLTEMKIIDKYILNSLLEFDKEVRFNNFFLKYFS